MKLFNDRHRRGFFSLAETLATIVIGAITLMAVLTVYRRVEDSAQAVNVKLDEARIPTEVLQKIAEDLDKVIATGPDTTITIKNGLANKLPKAKLTILRTFTDAKGDEQVLDEITWIAGYDYDRDNGTMILYRGHSGLSYEDKLLDSQRSDWETGYPLIPICSGVTYFKIEVPRGNDTYQDSWDTPSLPPGVRVSISFADPNMSVRGTLEVGEADKYQRTIAIDRTRKIQFQLTPTTTVGGDVNEPNSVQGEEATDEESPDTTDQNGDKTKQGNTLDKKKLDEMLNNAGGPRTLRNE